LAASKLVSLLAACWRDQTGAALVYVTVMMGVLVGFAALSVDLGRITTTHTQARSAAEAAALAAASQLDGTGDAITRATNAAITTPLVQNQQNLAQSPGTVTISALRFLNGLPAGTPSLPANPAELDPFVTTDPLEARFVEATTQVLTQNNMFAQAIGGGATANTRASAVAGFTQVVCKTVPLAVCNPAEAALTGAPFDLAVWRGRQVLVKASGPSSSWVPGDFGLVDIAGLQSAPAIAEALASTDPDVCVNSLVDLKPGQTQGARNALNTRFDMYDNPFFGGNERTQERFRPARNVTKGLIRTNNCTYATPEPGAASMALPRDSNLVGSTTDRFGNGTWDCLSYWNRMHPTESVPSGCNNASTPSDITRYELYRQEIDTATIPDHRTGTPVGEYGGPMCSSVTPSDDPDRRMLVFAVINCIEHGPISGNSAGPIPVEAFVKAFMTEPTGVPPDVNTYLEIVDIARPGADDGILHDLVQLYR
jgi:Flp pilus assembly protein TadG